MTRRLQVGDVVRLRGNTDQSTVRAIVDNLAWVRPSFGGYTCWRTAALVLVKRKSEPRAGKTGRK